MDDEAIEVVLEPLPTTGDDENVYHDEALPL